MEEPTDAYEFSFVAVPAQRGAGTTKAFESETSIFKMVMELSLDELAENEEALDAAISHLLTAKQSREERKARAEIAEKAKKIIFKGE